jgi:5-methyltetrahydrofolate--homocysteine methyltransferase
MPTTIESSEGKLTLGTGHPTMIGSMLVNTMKIEALIPELRQGKLDKVKQVAEQQRMLGVGLLNVMISHPEIDEKEMLPKVCKAAHDASGLAIIIDTGDTEALKRTLDAFPYKSIINSFSGERNKIESILPIAKESRSAVIGLCMDDDGIPETAEGRFSIAQKLVDSAVEYGIEMDDLIIDTLCLSASVYSTDSMLVTLESLRKVKEKFGNTTLYGTDNAGFGMPQKDHLDMVYTIAAISAGADCVLLEPPTTTSKLGLEGYTLFLGADFLSGNDPNGKRYLKFIRTHGLHKRSND